MRWRTSSIAVSSAATSVTSHWEKQRRGMGGADLGDEVLGRSIAMSTKRHWPSGRRRPRPSRADARAAAGDEDDLIDERGIAG